jgi:hypothetical protein
MIFGLEAENDSDVTLDSRRMAKIPTKTSSSSLFKSIAQLRTSLDEGYIINCVTHPATSTNEYSTMVDLINPNDGKECMITVFGEEAIALLEFVEKGIE